MLIKCAIVLDSPIVSQQFGVRAHLVEVGIRSCLLRLDVPD